LPPENSLEANSCLRSIFCHGHFGPGFSEHVSDQPLVVETIFRQKNTARKMLVSDCWRGHNPTSLRANGETFHGWIA
jgi:hypothetical protein